MSIKQINKVFDDTTLKGNEKLLMLALADNCNDSGVCFPSWNSLMTKTSMSKGSVSKWLKDLEDKKLVFRVSRNRQNGSRTSNKYLIYPIDNKSNLDEEDYLIFEDLYPSSEVELVQKLNYPSSEVELPNGGQSSEVEHLEPSLSFNHYSKPLLKQKYKKQIEFTFTLKKLTQFENLTDEYKTKLEDEIIKLNKNLSFEDFTMALMAKGYKYKNFLLAYKTWVKNDSKKPQQKSRAESNREFIREHYGVGEDGNIIDTEII